MPMVANMIRDELGLNPQLSDPDLAVAKGAAIYGDKLEVERLVTADLRTQGRLADGAPVLSASPTDVDESCSRVAAAFGLPVSGCVGCWRSPSTRWCPRLRSARRSRRRPAASWLVHRNQTLPIRVRRSFGTMRADQDIIELTVLEQAGQQESSAPGRKILIEAPFATSPRPRRGQRGAGDFRDGIRRRAARDGLPRRRRDTIAIVGENRCDTVTIGGQSRTRTGPPVPAPRRVMVMQPFSSNDYRKRVLAAVDRRGGLSSSIRLSCTIFRSTRPRRITDDQAVGRIEAVWAFRQKQRDHPKTAAW